MWMSLPHIPGVRAASVTVVWPPSSRTANVAASAVAAATRTATTPDAPLL